ncbi:AraC family transcriptional regulator [Mucilaginibacter sp.]|uniref:AraC family transcriptional regulator n=1 Tax=Mucilaginibacter sp. TaxID=1882438 RepID=UPI00374C8ACF
MRFFEDVDITLRDFESVLSAPHRHYYFELLYILSGKGVHIINGNSYDYEVGTLFMLTPEDAHTFKPDSATYCCIIDFTRSLFERKTKNRHDRAELSDFFVRLEYIFHHHSHLKGNLLAGRNEAGLFDHLIKQLVSEKTDRPVFADLIIQNIVFLLLQFIARIISEESSGIGPISKAQNRLHEITGYIQQHIYDKYLLRIDNLAAHFHKTPDHINRSFKQQTGLTLKDYINGYKMNLVESRLLYSELTVSEIANELQFTDESHLNKLFKKHKGKTAKQFRIAQQEQSY